MRGKPHASGSDYLLQELSGDAADFHILQQTFPGHPAQ